MKGRPHSTLTDKERFWWDIERTYINSAPEGCYPVYQESVSHRIPVLVESISFNNFVWCSEGVIS